MNDQCAIHKLFANYLFAMSVVTACTLQQAIAVDHPAPLPVKDSAANSEAEMKTYSELIEHSPAKIEMVPIKGGKFTMGSPASEANRKDDEGPQHEVSIAPFWMSKHEITWNSYEVWMSDTDILKRTVLGTKATKRDEISAAFQVSQPTEPYTDMSFGMGKRGYPAICMTQHAARVFCQWLSAKTGRYYRLPTEAEWEYACRAGTTTAYHFGDDPAELDDYAWHKGNTEQRYKKVGQKKPNAWGLHDMHGNVAEWVLDQHVSDAYKKHESTNPIVVPTELFPRVVRGGSFENTPELLRSAVRVGSSEDWKEQDPQEPQSIWYHTDALGVGLRIVRPLETPNDDDLAKKWNKSEPPQIDE
jgi:formylglycine-generating enzyme required for sulfatase activity